MTRARLAYRVAEAAEAIGLGERSLWRAISTGSLPVVRHGRATLILAETLEAWLRDQQVDRGADCPTATPMVSSQRLRGST